MNYPVTTTIVASVRKLNQRFACAAAITLLVAALAASRAWAVGAPLSITEADDGETLDIMKEDSLIITLPADGGADYKWQILKNDDAVMKAAGPPESKAGAPAHAVFTFSAIATGKETMTLGYSRPTDHDPAKTFTVNIRVSEP